MSDQELDKSAEGTVQAKDVKIYLTLIRMYQYRIVLPRNFRTRSTS